MGFGKAFGVGLAVFVGLNFAFSIIVSALSNQINTFFNGLGNMSNLAGILFGSISFPPYYTWGGIFELIVNPQIISMMGNLFLPVLILLVGYIITPILAAVLAGKMAGGKGAAFGSWFLVAIISAVMILVLLVIGRSATFSLTSIVSAILPGFINGIFYGCFALLTCGSEYY